MSYPQIPEQPETLTASELRALAAEIRTSVLAALADEGLTDEGLTEAESFKGRRSEILALARSKEAATALAAEMSDDSDDQAPQVEVNTEAPSDDDTDEDEDKLIPGQARPVAETVKAPGPDPSGPSENDEDAEASARPRVRTSTGLAAQPDTTVERVRPDQLVAIEGTPGHKPGDVFESWTAFAQAVMDKASMMDPASSQKFHVGRAYGQFDDAHKLTENLVTNLRLFEQEEITAAMCAPAIPTYNLGCASSARRPVRNSLAAFQPAARGAVTIYPSPTMEDITSGVGIWTADDDENPNAVKDPCATIECATPVEYRLYGIYRCITIKNLLQMTFPELVEAYLNRLSAVWARLAEVTLLNAMGTAVDTVEAAHVGHGGSSSIVRSILQYLAAYQELQRWDNPSMEVWMHRGVLHAVKADLVGRKRTDGGRNMVPSDAEVNRMFTDAGVTPHWTLDVANWMSPLPQFSTAGTLRDFTRNVEMLIAPTGKFAVMDRGELNIGVTGNGLYRDNVSNSRNEFTFFFENFEGLVDTDSCPAHIVELNDVCWNGQQIHDVFIDCEGDQTADAGS